MFGSPPGVRRVASFLARCFNPFFHPTCPVTQHSSPPSALLHTTLAPRPATHQRHLDRAAPPALLSVPFRQIRTAQEKPVSNRRPHRDIAFKCCSTCRRPYLPRNRKRVFATVSAPPTSRQAASVLAAAYLIAEKISLRGTLNFSFSHLKTGHPLEESQQGHPIDVFGVFVAV